MDNRDSEFPYSPGHPWYYFLGGAPLTPNAIAASVKLRGYPGYRSDIDKADRGVEPERSAKLRQIRKEVRQELWRDLSRYRRIVRDLHAYNTKHCVLNTQLFAMTFMSVQVSSTIICTTILHIWRGSMIYSPGSRIYLIDKYWQLLPY